MIVGGRVEGGRAREREAEDGHSHSSINRASALTTPAGHASLPSSHEDIFSQEAVMITECDGESHNTAATLHYCRRRILKPRDIISSILGYRPWNKDGADQPACVRIFNIGYFIFFFLTLCFGPVLQYNICLKRDQGIGREFSNYNENHSSYDYEDTHWCSGNLIFVYIVPSFLFIFSYVVTCIILRFGESEHLQTLLERVYLLASCSPWELAKQRSIWRTFVAWLVVGMVCLVWSLASMILHISAAMHIPYSFIIPKSKTAAEAVYGGAVGLLWLQDVVLVMSVLLYCTQCHLLSRLLHIIRTTVYQGATPLIIIKKQIEETSRFLRHLNQELGLSVGVFLCLLIFRVVTATATLLTDINKFLHQKDPTEKLTNQVDSRVTLHFLALVFNLLPWLVLTVLPLCTAARVSSNYRALNKAGSQLHGRPFGYQSTPQQDIDSFLLYVTSLHLHAKILWIPIRTYFLVSVLLLFIMSFVILSYLYS